MSPELIVWVQGGAPALERLSARRNPRVPCTAHPAAPSVIPCPGRPQPRCSAALVVLPYHPSSHAAPFARQPARQLKQRPVLTCSTKALR